MKVFIAPDIHYELDGIKRRLDSLEVRILTLANPRDSQEDAQRKAFTLKDGLKNG